MLLLGDPSRFAIVRVLARGARCVTELAREVGLSQSCTTRHLQALEREALVRGARDGKRVVFTLRLDLPETSNLVGLALGREGTAGPLPDTALQSNEEATGSAGTRPSAVPASRSDIEDFLL